MADIFSPDALRQSVHDTLEQATAAIPPGQDGALLIDATKTDADGKPEIRAMVVSRMGKNWTVSAGGGWDGQHVTGKVALAGSWKWH